MFRQVPQALGGPVLAWELTQGSRRKLWRYLQLGYCVWLIIQAVVLFRSVASTWVLPGDLRRLELFRTMYAQQIEFLGRYLAQVLQVQLILIVAVVPALTAGCLASEKERGTLFALFGTDLTSWQILLGKLLGRLLLMVRPFLMTLPVLVFLATMTGQGFMLIPMALAQEFIMGVLLGAVCLLFAIWIQRAADAILTSYVFLGVAYLVLRSLPTLVPARALLDPFFNLSHLLNLAAGHSVSYASTSFFENLNMVLSAAGPVPLFLAHLAVCCALGLFFLYLGARQLRKVCIEQRHKRPSRRLWAFRPPVGNHPIRWRECHVIGLAPMPILRLVPRGLALLAVFGFSAAIAALIANSIAPGFLPALGQFDLAQAWLTLWLMRRDITGSLPVMGLVFILLANILIGFRCGTSVAEEKRRNTWDDLLLTAQSFREITSGKMWGILEGVLPYVIAYAVPVFILAMVGGLQALATAAAWIFLPCAIVLAAALMGIDMVRVPIDMDQRRAGGIFFLEQKRTRPKINTDRRVPTGAWRTSAAIGIATVIGIPAGVFLHASGSPLLPVSHGWFIPLIGAIVVAAALSILATNRYIFVGFGYAAGVAGARVIVPLVSPTSVSDDSGVLVQFGLAFTIISLVSLLGSGACELLKWEDKRVRDKAKQEVHEERGRGVSGLPLQDSCEDQRALSGAWRTPAAIGIAAAIGLPAGVFLHASADRAILHASLVPFGPLAWLVTLAGAIVVVAALSLLATNRNIFVGLGYAAGVTAALVVATLVSRRSDPIWRELPDWQVQTLVFGLVFAIVSLVSLIGSGLGAFWKWEQQRVRAKEEQEMQEERRRCVRDHPKSGWGPWS